jgi:regulator of sirC expression with transglutaminase-like and TPR domain
MKTDANKNAALLRLLSDEDAATVALVKTQLAHSGPEVLEDLRALEELADALAAFHLRDVIAEIEEHSAGRIFRDLCARFSEDGALEEAVWRLAAAFEPGEDYSEARTTLDRWGREVARRLRKAATPLDRAETLAEFLNHEQKLRGTDADYDLDAALLPSVIDSRRGIPISVSLVYMFVARRAGLRLEGVNLPGHFIVRHEDIFLDPFRGGRRIGLDACKELLAAQNLTLLPQHLAPATPRQVLVRMLTSIYHIVEPTDPAVAAQVSDWIDALRKGAGAEV